MSTGMRENQILKMVPLFFLNHPIFSISGLFYLWATPYLCDLKEIIRHSAFFFTISYKQENLIASIEKRWKIVPDPVKSSIFFCLDRRAQPLHQGMYRRRELVGGRTWRWGKWRGGPRSLMTGESGRQTGEGRV